MTEVAAHATWAIANCTREAPIPRPLSNTSSATTAQPQVNLQPVLQSDDSAPSSSAQPVTQPDATAVQVTSESVPTRPLTQNDKIEISKIFSKEISSNETITLAATKAVMRETIVLRRLLLVPGMEWKVADCVRHCQATAPRSLPEDTQATDDRIQQWQEQTSTASSDTLSSSRREWSALDNQILETRFKDVTKCPTKKELASIM